MTGWANMIGWSVTQASGLAITTSSISGLVVFWFPEFQVMGPEQYAIYMLVAVVSILPLFAPGRWLSRLLQATLFFSVTGFAMILILVLTLRKQQQPLSFVTEARSGIIGWSIGPAWLLSIGNAM